MIYPETFTQLTAPGTTAMKKTLQNLNHTIVAVVANINTSLVLRVEGTIDGTNWFNLSDTNTDTTITANGVYGFMATGAIQGIRMNFVSETGGSSATIDCSYYGA